MRTSHVIFAYWLVANFASFYQVADDFEVFAVTELPGSNISQSQRSSSPEFWSHTPATHPAHSLGLLQTHTLRLTSSGLIWQLTWLPELQWVFPFFMSPVFSVYNFYNPGTKNVKADACLHAPEEVTKEPEPILLPNLILSPIQWSQQLTTSSNASETAPPGCPRSQHTPLITQQPTAHSRCLKIVSGGAIWPGTWAGSFKAALTVPSQRAQAIYQKAISICCRSQLPVVTPRSGLHQRPGPLWW